MTTTTRRVKFDSKQTSDLLADSFGFGVESTDWDAAAEAALFEDAICRGVVISTGPLPAPARRESAPSAADRAWWTAETLGRAKTGFWVEGEKVRPTRERLTARQEDELRWNAYQSEADYLEQLLHHSS